MEVIEDMYKIRTDEIDDENGDRFTVYGFDVVLPDNSNTVRSFPDIFFDKSTAEKFIEGLNDSDIDEKQIPEIVDDTLCATVTPDIIITH